MATTQIAVEVDRALLGLTGLRGVTAAAVIDGDGFVTHIRRDFDVDSDALGAAMQIVYGAAQRAAENVGQGAARLVLTETAEGFVLGLPLTAGFMLAVIADLSALLGSVRFEAKQTVPSLNQLFGSGSTAPPVRAVRS